jgi:hypothetical protein
VHKEDLCGVYKLNAACLGDFLGGDAIFFGVVFLDSTGFIGDFCLIYFLGVSSLLITTGESFLIPFDLFSLEMSVAYFYFLFCFVVSSTIYFSVG